MVEHMSYKHKVMGSIPIGGILFLTHYFFILFLDWHGRSSWQNRLHV